MTQLWKKSMWRQFRPLENQPEVIVKQSLHSCHWTLLKAEGWMTGQLVGEYQRETMQMRRSIITYTHYTNSPNAYLVHFWEANSLESIRWNLVKRRLRRSQCSRVVSAYGNDVLQQRAIHLKRKRNTSYEKKKIKEEWTNKEKKRMLTQREILGHRHTSRIVSRPFIYP